MGGKAGCVCVYVLIGLHLSDSLGLFQGNLPAGRRDCLSEAPHQTHNQVQSSYHGIQDFAESFIFLFYFAESCLCLPCPPPLLLSVPRPTESELLRVTTIALTMLCVSTPVTTLTMLLSLPE